MAGGTQISVFFATFAEKIVAMARSFARRAIAFSLFLTFLAVATKAQVWQFSVHTDPAVNWFYSDSHYVTNAGGQFGFRAGVEVTRSFVERVGFLLGASYDLRMANLLYADTALQVDTKYVGSVLMPCGSVLKTKAQYIYIPIGIKMRAIQIGYWSVTSAVGVSCDVLVSHRVKLGEEGIKKSLAIGFFTWGYPGYFFRVGAEYSLGGRSAIDMGVAYHGTFTAVAKPGIGNLYYHNLSFRIGFLF